MDFLKAAAIEAKRAAREQVQELRQGALELAEDLTAFREGAAKIDEGTKELEFKDGVLGFRLEGTVVISVEPGSQADDLGVEAGDRISAVAGYNVPDFEPDDFEEEQRAMKLVQKWLKEMPRPSSLTFVSVAAADEPSEDRDPTPAVPSLPSLSSLSLPSLPGEQPRPLGSPEPSPHSPAESSATASDRGAVVLEGGEAPEGENTSEQVHAALASLAASWQEDPKDGPDVDVLQADLQREQEERKQLVAELQRSRHARLQANSRLEAVQDKYQKRVDELESQLRAAREEGRKALLSASTGEADSFSALESSEAKNEVLEEEVSRLRNALDSAGREAAGAAAQSAAEVEDLHSRLVATEQRAEVFSRELRGLCEAHEAELDLARCERAELARQHGVRLEEEQRRWAEREEALNKALDEVRQDFEMAERRACEAQTAAHTAASEAAAAALEASTARLDAAARIGGGDGGWSAGTSGGDAGDFDDEDLVREARRLSTSSTPGGDIAGLHERIEMLERHCATLQKKLSARPVVFQSPMDIELGGSQRPSWELRVVATFGPRVGAALVVAYVVVDSALRDFTRRLLKRDAWLWIFYAHLVVLYAIAASSYSEVLPLADGSTVDINLRQDSVPSGDR